MTSHRIPNVPKDADAFAPGDTLQVAVCGGVMYVRVAAVKAKVMCGHRFQVLHIAMAGSLWVYDPATGRVGHQVKGPGAV